MDREAAELGHNQPFIMRLTSDTEYQHVIVVERKALFGFHNLRDGYISLFSCYFVFNIRYPPLLSCVLLFMQHFIFSLPVAEQLPSNLTRLYSVLIKM